MKKTEFKIFLRPIKEQERWLNRMASEGWRLTGVRRFFYTFERSEGTRYAYRVEFVGDKSKKELKAYKDLQKQYGRNVFSKGINIGKFSFGAVRWRPYAGKRGRFATSPGMINSELLIIESKIED
ncbi:DUF2812 domain-containing protein [Fontibacillus sp. BL9]|uniref:DUF2812 domain-containing protein n=1 Tax=Fontibacillus sp. BL9 TaxID=3389971 RepID=UPI00397BAD5C